MEAFGGLAGIGILFAGIGVAYSQFRSGSTKAKDELIATLKDTAIAEREKANQAIREKAEQANYNQTQLNLLNEKIGKLQGQYEESRERNKEYLSILQGRNPEQEKFMKFLTEFALETTKYMKDSSEILREIKRGMGEVKPSVVEEVKKTTTTTS